MAAHPGNGTDLLSDMDIDPALVAPVNAIETNIVAIEGRDTGTARATEHLETVTCAECSRKVKWGASRRVTCCTEEGWWDSVFCADIAIGEHGATCAN